MLRKLSVIAIGTVFIGLAAGGVTAVLAASNVTQPETITAIDTTIKGKNIDVGKPGFGAGDLSTFFDTLTDETSGSSIGTVHGECTFLGGKWGMCQAGAFLTDRGQIFVQGVVPFTQNLTSFDLAITGGTGEFDNVRGSVHLEQITNKKARITINILP